MTTGEKIRLRRLQLGLTTQKIADACGVDKSTVSRWETGKTDKINLGMLILIAKALYVEPIQLLNDDVENVVFDNSLLDKVIVKVNRLSQEELIKLDNLIDLMFKR